MKTELEQLRDENQALREALSSFTIAFRSHDGQANMDKKWSLGYWSGVDAGLALVNGNDTDPHVQNTRFRAVIGYTPENIQEALEAEKQHVPPQVA